MTTSMNRDTQQWLRDIVRSNCVGLTMDATFYYQKGGIKFWGINPAGAKAETIRLRVKDVIRQAAGQEVAETLEVYVGKTWECAPAALFVKLKALKAPKLEPLTYTSPPFIERPGFGGGVKPKRPVTMTLPIARFNGWVKRLDNLEGYDRVLYNRVVKDVVEEMQTALKKVLR